MAAFDDMLSVGEVANRLGLSLRQLNELLIAGRFVDIPGLQHVARPDGSRQRVFTTDWVKAARLRISEIDRATEQHGALGWPQTVVPVKRASPWWPMDDPSQSPSPADVLGAVSDPALREGLAAIFEQARALARSGDIDTIVITARRMANVYLLLQRSGLAPITECDVVSSRYLSVGLDLDPYLPGDEWERMFDRGGAGFDGAGSWFGRHVLVLDDTVVSGATLSTLYDDLVDRVGEAGSVQCLVACFDVDRTSDAFFGYVQGSALHTRHTVEVQAFAADLSRALYRSGLAGDTDLPATVDVTMIEAHWNDYLRVGPWHVVDVTPPMIGDRDHRTIALVPTDQASQVLRSHLHVDLAALVESFRTRAYVVRSGGSVRVRMTCHVELADATGKNLRSAATEALRGLIGLVEAYRGTEHMKALPERDRREFDAATEVLRNVAILERRLRETSPQGLFTFVRAYVSLFALLDHTAPGVDDGDDSEAVALHEEGSLLRSWARRVPEVTDAMRTVDSTALVLHFGSLSGALLASHIVLRHALARAPQAKGRVDPHQRDQFFAGLEPRLSAAMDDVLLRRILWTQRELVAYPGVWPEAPAAGNYTRIGLVFTHALLTALPASAPVSALGWAADPGAWADSPGRLTLTASELTRAIAPLRLTDVSWSSSTIPMGLDIASDLGVAVSTVEYDDALDLAFAAYRAGENHGLAGIALPTAARSDSWTAWDQFTVASIATTPILSTTAGIGETLGPSPTDAADRDLLLDRLRKLVLEAVPGEPEVRLRGVVRTRVRDGEDGTEFEAEVEDDDTGAESTITVDVRQVPVEQRERIQPGAHLSWTVWATNVASPDVVLVEGSQGGEDRVGVLDGGSVESARGLERLNDDNGATWLVSTVRVLSDRRFNEGQWNAAAEHYAARYRQGDVQSWRAAPGAANNGNADA